MKKLCIILCFLSFSMAFSQEGDAVISLEEYLGYVKMYHPVVKQAQLITSESEAKLLKSRGAFDPKIEVDYDRKQFKNIEYYNKLNTTFKIPTWYGIELKANYENNDGEFLNPESSTPTNGLYSAGVSISLLKGLVMSERMATLKTAKLYTKQAQEKQKLVINEILYNAINSYFNWLKNYQAKLVYSDYLINAETRLYNIKKSHGAGDKPAVDTLEASINYKNRQLDYEKAKINFIKSKLEISNYLWLENNLPLELQERIAPDVNTINKIDIVLSNSILNSEEDLINNHPKLRALEIKKEILNIDKRLKANNLLPKVDFQYNFLSSDYDNFNSINSANYKTGVDISFPIFLRKERGDLKLAKLKLQDVEFDISATRVTLNNKVEATIEEIESYKMQYLLLLRLVEDYDQLVKSEERMFILGEGSLFLVNYREVKLIENRLKKIDTEYKLFNSKSNLFRVISTL